jgi:hypothetical protein
MAIGYSKTRNIERVQAALDGQSVAAGEAGARTETYLAAILTALAGKSATGSTILAKIASLRAPA